LDASSVQTAPDGSRRIVWMIKRMIKPRGQRPRWSEHQTFHMLPDDDCHEDYLDVAGRDSSMSAVTEGLSAMIGRLGSWSLRRRKAR
jgi:hypothetical protein